MAIPLLAGAFSLSLIVPLVVKLLLALGISFVTYTGLTIAFDQAETFVLLNLGGLPADMYAILDIAGLPDGLAIIFSALTASVAVKTTLGAFTKMRMTTPTGLPPST